MHPFRFLLRGYLLAIYDYLVLYAGLIWLGLLCLAWTLLAILFYRILPDAWGKLLGRRVISAAFRFYLASLRTSGRCHFDLSALDSLRDASPMILAANHPSLLDAVLLISRLPATSCIMKAGLLQNPFLGAGARLARYICNEPVRSMVRLAMQDFRQGYHVLLFPEGTRTTQYPVNALKGSIALIAHKARVPVQTILIEMDTAYLSKGWPLYRKPQLPIHYRVTLGKRFAPPTSAKGLMQELDDYFRYELTCDTQYIPAPDESLSAQTRLARTEAAKAEAVKSKSIKSKPVKTRAQS